MLTNHCYVNIDPCWDSHPDSKGRKTIKKCCGKPDPDDPTGSDCCYDSWQAQLKDVSQKYDAANEAADQVKKKLAFVMDRRDRYKGWVIELDKTEDNAQLICHQLDIIASQSRKIWYNSCRIVQAIEVLFCMITDFYFQVDYLRKQYDSFMNCVNNNHSVPAGGILNFTQEYLQKLEAIIKTRDDIVKPSLEAIRLANLIRNTISTKKCPPSVPKNPPADFEEYDPCNPSDELCPDCCDDKSRYYGFKAIICEWHREFNCNAECEEIDPCLNERQLADLKQRQELAAKNAAELRRQHCKESQEPKPLPDLCKLKPVFHFPICNDHYKLNIEAWLKADDTAVRSLGNELKEKSKEKESLQACKDSLTKAVNEVNPKDRCK